MTVRELTRDQLNNLKQSYLVDAMDAADGRSPSYGELADASETISDEEIYSAYDGVEFTEDDFFSNTEDEDKKQKGRILCRSFLSEVETYVKSRKTAVDEDRIGKVIEDAPKGLEFLMAYKYTDTIGDVHNSKLGLRKIGEDKWLVQEHWFFEAGETICDKFARHSFIVAAGYRVSNITAKMVPMQ